MALIGAHVSASGGLYRAIQRADDLGCESMQLFTRNPLQWQGKGLSAAEVEAFRRLLLQSSVKKVISHASYLINLAGDDATRQKSIAAAAAETERCYQLGIDALVLHPGSSKGRGREAALEQLAGSLAAVLDRTEETPTPILLETMSGAGDILGDSIEELGNLLEALDWNNRIGVCCDMCHVFGAGLDIRTEGGYERLVASLDKHIGLERIGCWHISDNKGAKGSKIDRHAHLGDGEIGIVPFGLLVGDGRFAATPVVLETPKDGIGDEGNLALLRKLRGGK